MIGRVRLGDIADVFNGKTPSKAEQRDHGHPVLKVRDVDEHGRHRGTRLSFVDRDLAAKYSSKWVKAGDTLILNAAHNADYVASKTFFAGEEAVGSLATGEWLLVRPNTAVVHPAYANYWFRSSRTRDSVRFLVKGIHLYPKDVADLEVALPVMAEQRRIVDLLARAEGIVRLRREAQRKAAELIPAIFIDMFGDPATNPKRLQAATLGELIRVKSGEFLPAKAMNASGAVAVYGGNGVNGCHDAAMFDTDQVVIGRVGEYCGNAHLARAPCWVTDNALFVSEELQDFDKRFLVQLLRSLKLRNVRSQSGQPLVSAARIYPVAAYCPPLGLQREFGVRTQGVEALIGKLTAAAEKATATFDALLHQAFQEGTASTSG